MKRTRRLGWALGALCALGCSSQPAPVERWEAALSASNGVGVNGDGVNGDGVNSSGLGYHLVSVDLASGQLGGAPFDSVSVAGSSLLAVRDGRDYAGADLLGAQFNGTSDTGKTVSVRLDAIAAEPAPNDDTWDYTVSYWDPNAQIWRPLCKDSTGAALPAYALQGYWSYAFGSPGGGGKVADPSRFVFACKARGAVGKCVGWGYAPWRRVGGVSLDRTHQACVRMVRADFCGDGTSYTKDGNWVDLYDAFGIQTDTELWETEAEWDETGARCFYGYNRSSSPVPCYDPMKELGCGDFSHFQTGTLMIDELPPP